MELYKDQSAFNEIVRATSVKLGIAEAIVEKDYFVTLLLREISKRIPGVLFKGGTCLSKCFKLIDRFSEDIDLTLDKSHFTQSNKRNANKEILSVCDDLGFVVRNREKVESHSHGAYNCYEIEYPKLHEDNGLIPYIKLELAFMQKSYPDVLKPICSLISHALMTHENQESMLELGLGEFEIRAQALERTLVDKVFAICDYYISKLSLRQSRHIYDIYKLYNVIDKTNLKTLIDEVRKERAKNKTCLSAAPGCDVSNVIKEFIGNEFFKDDYEKVTLPLLSKNVQYNDAIEALKEISNLDLFAER